MGLPLLTRIEFWIKQKRERRCLTCPWCRHKLDALSGHQPPSHFTVWERDLFLDKLTCGVCQGTSLWRFEMCIMLVAPLDPPVPMRLEKEYYDVEHARLMR